MNSFYTSLLAAIFYVCCQMMVLVEAKPFTQENSEPRTKRHLIGGYGGDDSPIVLNHLLKQPILSFGPWFSPSRSKRFNDVEYEDSWAILPQPITSHKLKRALRQHKRMLIHL